MIARSRLPSLRTPAQPFGDGESHLITLQIAHVGHKVHRHDFGAKVRSGVMISTVQPRSTAISAACSPLWSPASS